MHAEHTNQPTMKQWINHIRSLIQSPTTGVPFDGSRDAQEAYISSFQDEYGNRRSTDRPFLNHLFGLKKPLAQPLDDLPIDEQLWWMVQSQSYTAEQVFEIISPEGGLLRDETLAIEYRTKVELCGLHACWIIAQETSSERLKARCFDAAAWHTRQLQPDNAINRPWATQVFLALSHQSDDPETRNLAHLHAQTLIHNTSISFGKPDLLSALILHDVVRSLNHFTQ